jgi:hypothetical protein
MAGRSQAPYVLHRPPRTAALRVTPPREEWPCRAVRQQIFPQRFFAASAQRSPLLHDALPFTPDVMFYLPD